MLGKIGNIVSWGKKKDSLVDRVKRTSKIVGGTLVLGGFMAACGFLTELQTGFVEKITASTSDITQKDIDIMIDEEYQGMISNTHNIIVHDKDGTVISETFNLTDKVMSEDVPDHVKWAFVAAEDRRFYDHHGWDYAILTEIPKVIYKGSLSGVRGHSTIPVQIADIIYHDSDYDSALKLKVDEWVTAAVLEQSFTKDEILVEYMNLANFGYSHREGIDIIGIDAAAEFYFGKEPNELDYLESALLASMIQNPAKLGVLTYDAIVFDKDPEDGNVVRLTERTRYVLRKMRELNFGRDVVVIPDKEYEDALNRLSSEPPPFKENKRRRVNPEVYGFVDEVLLRLPGAVHDIEHAIPPGSDIHIYTQLDMELQNELQRLLDEQCDALNETLLDKEGNKKERFVGNSFNGASVILNTETDAVIAMVDGCSVYDTSSGEPRRAANRVNRATSEFWHAGSVIKGIIDLIALENGYEEDSTIVDKRRVYNLPNGKTYSVNNFDSSNSGGPITIKEATVRSINSIFVELLYRLSRSMGEKRLVRTMNDFGFNVNNYQHTHGIGAFETSLTQLAGAYSVIPDRGTSTEYVFGNYRDLNVAYISRISIGDEYYITFEGVDKELTSRETASDVDGILREVVQRGTGTRANVDGMEVRGKTGTATGNVLFIGYEPSHNILAVTSFGLEKPGTHLSKYYQGGRHVAPVTGELFGYIDDNLDHY